jgi:hypothetical protein
MTTTQTTRVRVPPSTREVLQRQAADAERERQQKQAAPSRPAGTAVTPAKSTAVAVPDTRTPQQQYLDEIAPSGIAGRMIKFDGKAGGFKTADDDETVPDGTDFVALCDQTLIGWLKFNEDAPPDRRMGLLYENFVMPPRDTLGDLDAADWKAGLSGAPEDPWKHHIYLVLQHGETAELLTFVTSSQTGRRAIGNLLRHYDRMRRNNPGELPVIRLKVGGFQHRDDRIGWVPTPVLAVVGRAPGDSAAKPDTSIAADMNDEIPFTL